MMYLRGRGNAMLHMTYLRGRGNAMLHMMYLRGRGNAMLHMMYFWKAWRLWHTHRTYLVSHSNALPILQCGWIGKGCCY